MQATLLTKGWYERRGRLKLEFWVHTDSGPGRIIIDREPAVFFVERSIETAGERRELDLVSMSGKPVDGVYFQSQRDLLRERDRLESRGYLPLEADIWPSDRFLMERFITGTMKIEGEPVEKDGVLEWRNPSLSAGEEPHKLSLLSLDIETEGLGGRVISVAGVCGEHERVFVDTIRESDAYTACDGERATIEAFVEWVRVVDPDILTGWNVIGYDLRVLIDRAKANGFRLELGRGRGRTSVRSTGRRSGMLAEVEGRMVLDGGPTLRASGYYAERYSLEYTSQTLLGEGKTIRKVEDKAAEIMRLYREETDKLAEYNLKDCVLVKRIFEKQDLVGFVLERQQLTGLAMDRIGGSVAAFDYLYLPRLHRRGRVAKTIDSEIDGETSPGGYVMDSRPGLFRNVLVLDFKSLYPSIIRTFKVDPYGLVTADTAEHTVEGFKGARFARNEHILPALIEELWEARDEAKQRGDNARSTAIKILMNSFYGVLGTTGCRFFDPKLASSVTMRGHQVLLDTRELLEDRGYEVIYGDTDSVFVRVGDGRSAEQAREIGVELARDVNQYWSGWCREKHKVESHLEMEFETLYTRFFLPTKRDSSEGSKKKYAGLVYRAKGENELRVKGLEAVRTDWTRCAREFQVALFLRVFNDDVEDLDEWIRSEVRAVREGRRDEKLVYSKRLRQKVDDYTATPPHVQAALIKGGNPRRISYVITVSGPQPVGMVDAELDYHHYVHKQLKPAAEGILEAIGKDFDRIAGRQQFLF